MKLEFMTHNKMLVTYLLVIRRDEFDYDMLFYDNIEYFMQEYTAWERTDISLTGTPNPFDEEHYLTIHTRK